MVIFQNGYDVHHIDGDRYNNKISNLELIKHSKHLSLHKSKPVAQYTMNNELIKTWNSVSEAVKNGYSTRNIVRCCKGLQENHKGFKWKYIDYDNKRE